MFLCLSRTDFDHEPWPVLVVRKADVGFILSVCHLERAQSGVFQGAQPSLTEGLGTLGARRLLVSLESILGLLLRN